MLERLYGNWVYGGTLAAILLLCLAPLLLSGWPVPMIAVFLQLPVYMIHQYEEHDAGRFGHFVNSAIGRGRTVLSDAAIFVINVPGVWGVNAISIWLAALFGAGFGLIGIYLTLVNGLVHIAQAIRMRAYNPGLGTAGVLFLPVSLWALIEVSLVSRVTIGHHVLGLAIAIFLHAAIVAHVFRNRSHHGERTVR